MVRPDFVKISDFGMSRALGVGSEYYTVSSIRVFVCSSMYICTVSSICACVFKYVHMYSE